MAPINDCYCCDYRGPTDTHHASYYPERTVEVCPSCHRKIHQCDGFHDELKPESERPADYAGDSE